VVTWQAGPDFKTIADFRKNNGEAIRLVCREFVMLCRKLNLFSEAFVAIDGSKFRVVNNRNRNFSKAKLKKRLQQIDASIERYLGEIASTDRREGEGPRTKTDRLENKIAALKEEIQTLKKLEVRMLATPDQQTSQTDPDARVMSTAARSKAIVGYNVQAAVDTTNHLIVAHEVANVGHDRSQLPIWPDKRRKLSIAMSWAFWQIAVTSAGRRFWPVKKLALLLMCRRHRPQTTRPRGYLASEILSTSPRTMSISARQENV
jgi:hypothetical protein